MQWHQLDHMQTICTSLQTDNHTNTSSLNFYRPNALPDAQPTLSKHWKACQVSFREDIEIASGIMCSIAFIALTLLAGRHEGHLGSPGQNGCMYVSCAVTWYAVWLGECRTSGLGPGRARPCLDAGVLWATLDRIGPMWWYVESLVPSSGGLDVNCRPLRSGSEPVLVVTDGIWMLESGFGESWMLQCTHTARHVTRSMQICDCRIFRLLPYFLHISAKCAYRRFFRLNCHFQLQPTIFIIQSRRLWKDYVAY